MYYLLLQYVQTIQNHLYHSLSLSQLVIQIDNRENKRKSAMNAKKISIRYMNPKIQYNG